MKHEILQPGAFAMLKVDLQEGENVKAESDAMVSMTGNIELASKMEGGILGGLARKFLRNESAFFQTLEAKDGSGSVTLAPSLPGDIIAQEISSSKELFIQSGAFLAAEAGVDLKTSTQKLTNALFSGAGVFVSKATGNGTIFLNTFGAIYYKDLEPGEKFVVDNGHLVAWETTLDYSIGKATHGIISSFTSGEGLVCKFSGHGRIIMQSRNPGSFINWISSNMPRTSSGSILNNDNN